MVAEDSGLQTKTTRPATSVAEISKDLRQLLADVFALYVKTKGAHWHMTGAHFRDYHLLLDEQAEQCRQHRNPNACGSDSPASQGCGVGRPTRRRCLGLHQLLNESGAHVR